jgi:hypothetical protein
LSCSVSLTLKVTLLRSTFLSGGTEAQSMGALHVPAVSILS